MPERSQETTEVDAGSQVPKGTAEAWFKVHARTFSACNSFHSLPSFLFTLSTALSKKKQRKKRKNIKLKYMMTESFPFVGKNNFTASNQVKKR